MGICSYKIPIIIRDSRIQVVIPKYNELNQSPPICFNKHCMLVDLKVKQCQSPSIDKNKHCINKHITQCERFDEYYYNKYMNSPNN